jgi:hypothetical protein
MCQFIKMLCNNHKIPSYIAGNSITDTKQFQKMQSNKYKNPSFKACVCEREREREKEGRGREVKFDKK